MRPAQMKLEKLSAYTDTGPMATRKEHVKTLAEVLGFEQDDPEILAASEDARRIDNLFDALVAHRQKLKLSQSKVAERMGTTQSAVSELERSGSNPKLFTLLKYARAIDMQLRFAPIVVNEGCWHSTSLAPSSVTAATSQPLADWPAEPTARSA